MTLKKEPHYVDTYMGETYTFPVGDITTVGDLAEHLQELIDDLPNDKTLEVSEVDLRNNKLKYTLSKGIVQ